jgi:anti-sigma factor RsiW
MIHPDEPHEALPERPRVTGPGPHDDVLRWVSKELDGELGERERVLLGDHLEACLACAKVHRELRGIRDAARTHDAVQLPVGLVDRVATHVLAPEPSAAGAAPLPPLIRLLRRSAAVAAAVLLLLGGIYVGRLPSGALAKPIPRHYAQTHDAALERALARWTAARDEPSFFPLLLPATNAK